MSVLDDLWKDAIGAADWLKQVIFGEFDDHQSTSAIVAGMLVSFVPGAVIVMSARDLTAVLIRMVRHPEKRDSLQEWMILVACAIGLVPALVGAAVGAAGAGVGAIVGGLAGDEAGAALRATALLLIEDGARMLERLVEFLRRFVKGDILRFLREAKFITYAEPVAKKVTEFLGHMGSITNKVIVKASSVAWIGRVGHILEDLKALERGFYELQGIAGKRIMQVMHVFDARKDAALAEHMAQLDHPVHPHKPAPRPPEKPPVPKRVVARADAPLGKAEGLEHPDPLPPKTEPKENLHPQGVESEPTAKPEEKLADGSRVTVHDGTLYRVDGRSPDQIFDGDGFQPLGTSTDDVKNYVLENPPSGFVSTSTSPEIAKNTAFAKPGTYVYEVDGSELKGVDVNTEFPANPLAGENEFAVVGGVPSTAVKSAREVLPGGALGEPILNPKYEGK